MTMEIYHRLMGIRLIFIHGLTFVGSHASRIASRIILCLVSIPLALVIPIMIVSALREVSGTVIVKMGVDGSVMMVN